MRPSPPAPRPITFVVVASCALAASMGCAPGDGGSGAPGSSAGSSTTTIEPLAAADGSDVRACDDGFCEILVGPRTVAIPLEESVTQRLHIRNLTLASTPEGNVVARSEHASGEFTQAETHGIESSAHVNGVTITPLAQYGGRVVVRLGIGGPPAGGAVAPGELIVLMPPGEPTDPANPGATVPAP